MIKKLIFVVFSVLILVACEHPSSPLVEKDIKENPITEVPNVPNIPNAPNVLLTPEEKEVPEYKIVSSDGTVKHQNLLYADAYTIAKEYNISVYDDKYFVLHKNNTIEAPLTIEAIFVDTKQRLTRFNGSVKRIKASPNSNWMLENEAPYSVVTRDDLSEVLPYIRQEVAKVAISSGREIRLVVDREVICQYEDFLDEAIYTDLLLEEEGYDKFYVPSNDTRALKDKYNFYILFSTNSHIYDSEYESVSRYDVNYKEFLNKTRAVFREYPSDDGTQLITEHFGSWVFSFSIYYNYIDIYVDYDSLNWSEDGTYVINGKIRYGSVDSPFLDQYYGAGTTKTWEDFFRDKKANGEHDNLVTVHNNHFNTIVEADYGINYPIEGIDYLPIN